MTFDKAAGEFKGVREEVAYRDAPANNWKHFIPMINPISKQTAEFTFITVKPSSVTPSKIKIISN